MARPFYRGAPLAGGGGSGTVAGSTGATDKAALRASGSGGATVQNSDLVIGDVTGGILPLSSASGSIVAIQPVAGIDALRLGTVTSGVNYAAINPSISGANVSLGVGGADATIGISITPKNNGKILLNTTGLIQISGTTSASPALFSAGGGDLSVRLADDSNYGNIRANVFAAFTGSTYNAQIVPGGLGGHGLVAVDSDGGFFFSSSNATVNTMKDAGIVRRSAGVIQPSDGSATGFGQMRCDGTTGAGAPLFGTNSPASTLTNPYSWLKFKAPDGTQVYVPAWA